MVRVDECYRYARGNIKSTLVQLFFSFHRGMRVEKTPVQTLASQLSSTLTRLTRVLSSKTSLLQIVLVVATGTVGFFAEKERDFVKDRLGCALDSHHLGEYGRFEFFWYPTSVGVSIAIISLVASITGLLEKQGGTFAVSCCKYSESFIPSHLFFFLP